MHLHHKIIYGLTIALSVISVCIVVLCDENDDVFE